MPNKKYILEDAEVVEARIHNQRVTFLEEEIREMFWILLVTCPECGCINSLGSEEPIEPLGEHQCFKCLWRFRQDEYPDLFY